ncbi:MAG: DNA helicase PcrA [Actinobacteria bacterium]|nr:MAG: DNA helicase PcrA [Actinomycetota bacterium]
MDILNDLNPVQKKAVKISDGPLLILAGAGSGKTRVLTYRIAYLLQKGVSPHNILAITFTNKAAKEMKQRVKKLAGKAAKDIWISTFHSTCARILRKEINRLGYRKSFTIYDDDDKKSLLTACLKELDLDPKQNPARKIGETISNAKNELIDSDTFLKSAETYYEETVAGVYRLYQEKLYLNNAVDFDDLIMLTVNLFELDKGLLDGYQHKFSYILVDEYQDTNHAQYRLVNLLAFGHRNLCVVGDEDQSIYKWRGADIRNILDFEKDYKETKLIKLEQNYRSTQNILSAANLVISNNSQRKEKNLWTDNHQGEQIFLYQAGDEHEEAAFVATEVDRLAKEGVSSNQMAVFYRVNAQSRVLEEVFLRYGLPYKIVGGVKFYERAEIKDILAYLRVLVNPDDTISLKRIINKPARGIGKTTVEAIEKHALSQKINFHQALLQVAEIKSIAPGTKKKISDFLELIEELKNIKCANLADKVERIALKTGYIGSLKEEKTLEAEGRLDNIKEFVSVVQEFCSRNPKGELTDFLEEISLITDIDNFDEKEKAVTFMTLHNAKGLEFPVVFMTGMEEGLFPHFRCLGDSHELEEERRLCYVGMTRAMQKLYLSHAFSRRQFGSTNYNIRSRFLSEVPEELLFPLEKKEAPTYLSKEIYELGDKVVHQKFGRGIIKEIQEPDKLVVVFSGGQEKTLLLGFAPLEKV